MSTNANVVFVFGSNREGRHGAGAAKDALCYWGAVWGKSSGRQGMSYAIVTKELRKNQPPVTFDEISFGVNTFLLYASENQDIKFAVTAIGCGLAGFSAAQIAPLFKNRTSNVILPIEFCGIADR